MNIKLIKKIAKGKYLNFFIAESSGKAGLDNIEHNFNYEFFSRKKEITIEPDKESNADAVVIIAIHANENEEKRLVVIKQFRPPVRDYIYELPAGLIDPGEDAVTAAKRELKEETGLDVVEVLDESSKIYSSPGCTDESCIIITVICEGKLSTNNLEDNEDIEPMLLTSKEIRNIVESNPKMGVKCWFVMQTMPIIFSQIEKELKNEN